MQVKQTAIVIGGIRRQHNTSAHLEHPAHFTQRGLLIRHVIEHVIGHQSITDRIGQGQVFGPGLDQHRRQLLGACLLPGLDHHAVGCIQTDHAHAPLCQQRMVSTRPAGHVRHDVTGP